MKLLRVGKLGSEIVAALDGNNVIRDLSDHIKDLNPQTVNEETLNKLKSIKLSEQKEINSNIRVGACISNPVDFLAIVELWSSARFFYSVSSYQPFGKSGDTSFAFLRCHCLYLFVS